MKNIPVCPLLLCIFVFTSSALAESLFEKGLAELNNENYEEALDYFLGAYRLEPRSSKLAFYVGLAYKLTGNYRDAANYLKEALTLTPRVKEALVELIDVLCAIDNLKDAKEWIELGEREGVDPPKIQFFKGLVLSREGRYKEAIEAFERAKSLDRALAQACELQIGLAQAREGKLKEARERFKSVISLDPSSDLATYAKDYETMVEERLKAERPWRFSVSLNYKYDSNVVSKGTGPMVDRISGQNDSALNLGLRLVYTFPFSFRTPYNLSLQYSLFAERYFPKRYIRADGSEGNLSEYNNMSNSFSATFGRNFRKWALSFLASYTYHSLQGEKGNTFFNELNWWNTTRYMDQFTVTPTARFQLGKRSMGEFAVGIGRKNYFTTPLRPPPIDPEERRDANLFWLSAGLICPFRGDKGVLTLRYTSGKEDAKGRYWSIESENKVGLVLLYPLESFLKRPIKVLVSGEACFDKYRFEHAVFDRKRRDDIYDISGALIYEGFLKDLLGKRSRSSLESLDLVIRYDHVRNKSNIPVYDYKREILGAGLEYKF